VAEEWETRKAEPPVVASDNVEGLLIAPEQVAALVGSLLMNEHIEAEKLRRHPVSEDGAEMSRWRDAGRREILRRI